MSDRRIFVVRHAQSEWNGTRRISGQLDPPLSEKGRQQAADLARLLEREPLTEIYSSSLLRSIETALPVAESHQLRITTCDEFKEINFGVLQGRYRDERDPEAQELWNVRARDKKNCRVPGGESFAELEHRVRSRLDQILDRTTNQSILIVGHRSTNRVLLSTLMNWTSGVAIGLNLRNKFVYEVILSSTPQLVSIDLGAGTRCSGFRG